VDHIAKRVRVFQDEGTSLAPVAEYTGGYQSYYSSIAVDHFGNVYLADNTQSTLLKLTAALEPLDEEGGTSTYAALAAVNVPFGMITVDGQGTYWAGFDQLFAVEQWTGASGARRRTLGLSLKNIMFTTDENGSAIHAGFTMTDFGTVGVLITDAAGAPVRTIPGTAMVSGLKDVAWDRRDDSGHLVPPGSYRCTLNATDPYRQETISASAEWTLPLYYDEEGGVDEPQLTRGTPLRWGTNSASTDPQSVQYRFTGLNPAGTYAVSASCIAPPDGLPRSEQLSAGSGWPLDPPMSVGQTMTSTGFLPIPPAAYASGELLLSVNRLDQGSSVISRLVLKETGRAFAAVDGVPSVPAAYALAQNFPNPFNPSTVISYGMPADGRVSIMVYDILGKQVATLIDGLQTAGTHAVTWNATDKASGVYFVRMRANDAVIATRKMILLK
jgi:hypothetical protein